MLLHGVTWKDYVILRDVLGFTAAETSLQLETSVPSVTSALQRARATATAALPARSQQEALRALGDRAVAARQRSALTSAERAWEELGVLMGVGGQPAAARVTRFVNAFPQYRVHHLLRTAGVESALARIGGVAVAGSAYRGVGIPACIASGRSAARALLL